MRVRLRRFETSAGAHHLIDWMQQEVKNENRR
jgi:hypothetical protein